MKLYPRKAVTLWQPGDLPPQRHCLECGRGFFMEPTHRGRPYVTCSDQCARQRNRMLDRASWHRTHQSRLSAIPVYSEKVRAA